MTDYVEERKTVKQGERGKRVQEKRVIEDNLDVQSEVARKVTGLIWLALSAVETVIGLRFLLTLVEANRNNLFASWIYAASDWLLLPFQGLLKNPVINGIELDILALVALLVYSLATYLVVRLVWLVFNRPASRKTIVVEKE